MRGLPNEEAIQIEVGPFLRLPPVICLTFCQVLGEGSWRDFFRDGLKEQCAPPNHNLLLSQENCQIKLHRVSIPPHLSDTPLEHTKVACLYAFNTICSISPASSLVSFINPCPIVKSLGKVATTILSKSARFSPDLKR